MRDRSESKGAQKIILQGQVKVPSNVEKGQGENIPNSCIGKRIRLDILWVVLEGIHYGKRDGANFKYSVHERCIP